MTPKEKIWLSLLVLLALGLLATGLYFQKRTRNLELHMAIVYRDYSQALELLESGGDPNMRVYDDEFPIHTVVWAGDLRMLRLLLDFGVDCTRANDHGTTPTMLSLIRRSRFQTSPGVTELLIASGCDDADWPRDKAEDILGRLADELGESARSDIEYVLRKGATGDVTLERWDTTGIHIAASAGNDWLVKLLLNRGVDPNLVDTDGNTPIDRALELQQFDMMALLREHGGESSSLTESELDAVIEEGLAAQKRDRKWFVLREIQTRM